MTLEETHSSPAPSPFIPDTNIQYAWDSTSLGYLKTCPRLYQYIMIDGWSSPVESIHLRFGIEYHSALQDYDHLRVRGEDHDEALNSILLGLLIRTKDWHPDRDTKAGKYKNRDTLIRSVINYLDNFTDDPAETYILDNGQPAVELSFRFELGYGPTEDQPYMLSGHLDRVVRFNDELYVMDHKTTTTTLSSYYFDQYHPHNQMSLYSLAGKILLDSPVRGVMIDGIQLLVDSDKFIRGFTIRTSDQIEEWVDSLSVTLRVAEAYAKANFWPMNDTACGNYGGCRFREVCSKSPHVRDIYLKGKFTKLSREERWNPLKSR